MEKDSQIPLPLPPGWGVLPESQGAAGAPPPASTSLQTMCSQLPGSRPAARWSLAPARGPRLCSPSLALAPVTDLVGVFTQDICSLASAWAGGRHVTAGPPPLTPRRPGRGLTVPPGSAGWAPGCCLHHPFSRGPRSPSHRLQTGDLTSLCSSAHQSPCFPAACVGALTGPPVVMGKLLVFL